MLDNSKIDIGIKDFDVIHIAPWQQEIFDAVMSGKRVCCGGGRMMGKTQLYKILRAYIAAGLLKEHRIQWVEETSKLSVERL